MTKKEFKKAMCQGLGRCQQALRSDPEKYRDIVLWACQRDIAYDTQCEGTRAYYVYKMACVYEDVSPFVEAAAAKLDRYKPQYGWDLAHLTELLSYFADDGNVEAKAALVKKYKETYAALMARKRRRYPMIYELWDMECIGVVLTGDWVSTKRIISDCGRLYMEKSYLEDGDFGWLHRHAISEYPEELSKESKENPYVACFLKREKRHEDEWRANMESRLGKIESYVALEEIPDDRVASMASIGLKRKGTPEQISAWAEAYRKEQDPELRWKKLRMFTNCPYPDDPAPIIADALLEEDISSTAISVLEQLRYPEVKAVAMEQLVPGDYFIDWFAVFVSNYEPADEKLLQKVVEEMVLRGDKDEIHFCGMKIMNMYDEESEYHPSRKLLLILYEATPCAECRFHLLWYMRKHRLLTEEILEECLEDSNSDIQNYAKKLLKRRQAYRNNMKF